jgi:hypothetical protein
MSVPRVLGRIVGRAASYSKTDVSGQENAPSGGFLVR